MTPRAEVVDFPKRCPHGMAMKRVRRFSGPSWWDASACSTCHAAELEREEADLNATEEWLDRISEMAARKK